MTGYGSRFIESLFEIPQSTLGYWDRQGVVKPSIRPAAGRGSRRLYSFRDLVALRTVMGLRDRGVPLQRIQRCIQFLCRNFPDLETPLAEIAFITDGEDLFARTDKPNLLMDTLRQGQLLWVVPVGAWAQETRTKVDSFARHKEGAITVDRRKYTFTAEYDPEDGWWVAFVNELRSCGTQGSSWEELLEMLEDAIRGYLDEEAEEVAAL